MIELIQKLLTDASRTILSHLVGHGFWTRVDETYDRPDGAMSGLSVGDSVWYLDDEEMDVMELRVVHITDGVGYYAYDTETRGPVLFAVFDQLYYRTAQDAVLCNRDDIEQAFSRMKQAQRLMSSFSPTPTKEEP